MRKLMIAGNWKMNKNYTEGVELAQGLADALAGKDLNGVEVVVDQIKADTEGLEITDPSKYVIAYEPIWAIGTGKTATADDAQEVCGAIRETLVEIFGAELADGIRVLYGGSAKPGNIAELVAKPDVDGALVGGASLKAEDFSQMVIKAGE